MDGFVSIHRTQEDTYQGVCSIRVSELRTAWPSVAPLLARDSYFSVNGFFRAGSGTSEVPGQSPALRRENSLRYLNAAFLDLDCYRAGVTPVAAAMEIDRLCADSAIPAPSLLLYSGRGLWVFFVLYDPARPHMPSPAYAAERKLYRGVQDALVRRLADLAPDAHDAVRTARIPGSMNGKAGERTSYTVNQIAGTMPRYTLKDLATVLQVEEPKPRTVRKPLSGDAKAGKRRGQIALYEGRLRQFEKLWSLRGGFQDGCRNYAALLLVHFLRRLGKPEAEIARQLDRMADACHPPLHKYERRGALRSGLKPMRVRDQTIARWLAITPEESRQLAGWPPATWTRDQVDLAPPNRSELLAARHKLILQIVAEHPNGIPSVRMMARCLVDMGYKASTGTVYRDYVALRLTGG